MNDNILINVTDLKKTFGDHEVLKGINTTISKGEVIAIIGPSGAFFRESAYRNICILPMGKRR